MKQFTLKDLIKYNGPCKICNLPTNIIAELHETEHPESYVSVSGVLENNNLLFKLTQTYYDSLELMIDPKNNYIYPLAKTEARKKLDSFLSDHFIVFYTTCPKCHTSIQSNQAEFVLSPIYPYLKPLEITFENVNLITDNCYYSIRSSIQTDTSKVFVHDLRTNIRESFEAPLIQLSEMKNSAEVLERIKIIIAFS